MTFNILYISQYYPPEMGAPSQRVSELAKFWVKQGYGVTVITGMPNHPDGVIHKKYKWEYFKEEWTDGVRVLRVFLYVTPNKGILKRIFSFISFTVTSLFAGLFMNKPDIVIATSPQLFVGLSGLFIAKLKRIPFVFEVRDIWPQSAVELKMIRSHFVINLMEKLERFFYFKAERVVIVVDSFRNQLMKKHVPDKKMVFIPNGIDKGRFEKKCPERVLKMVPEDKKFFTVGYFGTIGLAHGLEIVIKAAEHYKGKDVRFVIVGDGAERTRLEKIAESKNLSNLFIAEKISSDKIPCAISEIDAGLIHLKNLPIFRDSLPSKMFEYMGMGKPVLAGVLGNARELVEKNRAGVAFDPENLKEFIEAIELLKNDASFRKEAGENAKKLVEKDFNREVLSEKYLKMLGETIK